MEKAPSSRLIEALNSFDSLDRLKRKIEPIQIQKLNLGLEITSSPLPNLRSLHFKINEKVSLGQKISESGLSKENLTEKLPIGPLVDPVQYMEMESPTKEFNEMDEILSKGRNLVDSAASMNQDSLAQNASENLSTEASSRLESKLSEELDSNMDNAQLSKPPEMDELSDLDFIRLDGKKAQQDHFQDRKILERNQDILKRIKKKYAEVRDSRKLNETLRRNSFNDTNLFHRMEFGLNAASLQFSPFFMILKPFAGFRLDKKWSVGGGGIFSIGGKEINKPGGWNGHHLYTVYKLKPGLFIIGEYQNQAGYSQTPDEKHRNFHMIWGGVGTELRIGGRIHVRSQMLYGVNKKTIFQKGDHKSPWQLNMGIVYFKAD
jgi:hypothetical protein